MTHRPRFARAALAALLLAVPATGAHAQRERAEPAAITVSISDAGTGEFLPGAWVSIVGSRDFVRTDTTGLARLTRIEPGTHLLRVRMLGFSSFHALVTLPPGERADLYAQLRQAPMTLATVTVAEAAVAPWLREFEERRQRGLGRYITNEEIRAAHGESVGALVQRKFPGLRIGGDGSAVSQRASGRAACRPLVFLDEVLLRSAYIEEVPLSALGGIEFYSPSTAPVEYRQSQLVRGGAGLTHGDAACGVLLLWTAPPLR